MTDGDSTAQETEFNLVARWTAEELAGRDQTSVLAGASRGSGSPSALAWLAESLAFAPDVRLLDVGSGLGGPAAWAATRYGVHPLGVEPMDGAAEGASQLFAMPTVIGGAEALPVASASFDVAWTLGVLDTIDHPVAALAEIRRCLVDDGRLGVLAYVADEPIAPTDVPEGNHFPTTAELLADLADAGFVVVDWVGSAVLANAPLDWSLRQERLDDILDRDHGTDPRWQRAKENADAYAALLDDGRVTMILVHALCV